MMTPSTPRVSNSWPHDAGSCAFFAMGCVGQSVDWSANGVALGHCAREESRSGASGCVCGGVHGLHAVRRGLYAGSDDMVGRWAMANETGLELNILNPTDRPNDDLTSRSDSGPIEKRK